MKRIGVIFGCLLFFLCVNVYLCYSEGEPAANKKVVKEVDVNKDGKPEVVYYGDAKNVTEVEADTNYDGKPDVKVHIKDGKFESAEADTDYNGTMETKFTDAGGFNKWVNEKHPGFEKELVKQDWRVEAAKF